MAISVALFGFAVALPAQEGGSGQAVASFTVINADTNTPIPGYENLLDGSVIDAANLDTSNLNIRANTNAETTVGSVSFSLDDYSHVENISPFALFANKGADYFGGHLTPGTHVLTATPYTKDHATGIAGASLTISFTLTQTGPTPTPTPNPTPTPSATPTPAPTATPTPTPSPSATPITSVALAWNASTSANIAGYRVSYGVTSGIYTQQVDVGNMTSATISGLTSGRTYYFAVSAYDTSAVESAFSNEVSFTIGSTSSSVASVTTGESSGTSSSSSISATNSQSSGPTATGNSATATGSPSFGLLSSRLHVGIGSNVGMEGFFISGSARKTVVARVLGPSLTRYGLKGVLTNPMLEIHDARGNIIASNDGWRLAQPSAFTEGGRYHSLQPGSDLEPAIVLNLPTGAYTAIVRGKNNTQGLALAEIYDVSEGNGSKLSHLSTRAFVSTGDDLLVGRVNVSGDTSLKVVVRVLGPSLARYGIANSLASPRMNIYNSNGVLLHSANNWTENSAQANLLRTSGYAPTDQREPAMMMLLPAGTYAAVVSGENNTTGVALFDAYSLN